VQQQTIRVWISPRGTSNSNNKIVEFLIGGSARGTQKTNNKNPLPLSTFTLFGVAKSEGLKIPKDKKYYTCPPTWILVMWLMSSNLPKTCVF
jgi:hypothetical protein